MSSPRLIAAPQRSRKNMRINSYSPRPVLYLTAASLGVILILTGSLAVILFTRSGYSLNLQLPLDILSICISAGTVVGLVLLRKETALHDSLTHLPNKALLIDRLKREIKHPTRRLGVQYSLLYLDIDHFKIINDSLGHTLGDQLLISIAGRLANCLHSGDMAARLGGDEFVLLLKGSRGQDAILQAAARFQEALNIPFNLNGQAVYVSASIGIVLSVAGYNSPDEVLRDADIAMYRAKSAGRSCSAIFESGMRTTAITRLELEGDLRRALEGGEFQLYYQPIMSLETNVIIGFEALIRWNHPRRGFMLPADFLAIAEETGLIIPIGQWVLLAACTQMKKWHENYYSQMPLAINVNISAKQLAQPDFVDQVVQVLEDTGLPSENLKLEITENAFVEQSGAVKEILNKLCDLGIQLQIDDFGTGYSSFGYLRHFPIQTIKIDKSFIRDMGKNGKGSEIIRAMVGMAQDLGIDTIAEGVETDEELRELKGLMCKFGQGYLLSRPVDSHAAGLFLESIHAY